MIRTPLALQRDDRGDRGPGARRDPTSRPDGETASREVGARAFIAGGGAAGRDTLIDLDEGRPLGSAARPCGLYDRKSTALGVMEARRRGVPTFAGDAGKLPAMFSVAAAAPGPVVVFVAVTHQGMVRWCRARARAIGRSDLRLLVLGRDYELSGGRIRLL